MTERASKILTGLFVLGAVALMCAGTLVLGAGSMFSRSSRFVMFFEQSTRGLTNGAPVYFKGVKVGKVVNISLEVFPGTGTFKTPVIVEVDGKALSGPWDGSNGESYDTFLDDPEIRRNLIDQGLRATLTMSSFITGQLAVVLDITPDAPKVDFNNLEDFNDLPQLPTAGSAMDDLINKVSSVPLYDIAREFLNVLNDIDSSLNQANVGGLSKGLLELIVELKAQAEKLGTLQDSGILTLNDIRTFARESGATVAKIAAGIEKTLSGLRTLESTTQTSMEKFGKSLSPDSPEAMDLARTLKSIRDAANSLARLANMLEGEPASLIFGRQ